MAEAKRGRPSVGPRVEITTRIGVELADALRALAKARGTTLTDVMVSAIKKELDTTSDQSPARQMSQVA